MAQVTVTLNGRDYAVACGDGEEDRIRALAGQINTRIAHFVAQLGQVGETRLMVLAALTLADELADARSASGNGRDLGYEASVSRGLDALAKRIETVAIRLETAKI